MYLAINYSPAAARLVQAGKIHIDYFKTPNWDELIAQARELCPVAIHFTLEAGNDSLGDVDWEKIQQQLFATKTPYVNLHLDARQTYYPAYQSGTTHPSEVANVTQVILSDVMKAVERFGAERVIIENSPYQGVDGNTMALCVQPNLIKQVVMETGCGFLLDISHAIITARYLDMQPEEYISNLPVEHIKELHFAGMHYNQASGHWMDHLSIQEEDWQWLDWALERVHSGEWSLPWLLAFEYGGVGEPFEWRSNPQVIAEQVPKLCEHIQLFQV
ncbi:MAG TPA: DUF692 family protein [Anaerolineales bacterium]|nr:DUF692 family protein [Anaerolineales bacterium]